MELCRSMDRNQASKDRLTFGELLRRRRQAAGLSQAALAEASGISVRTLRDLEQQRVRSTRTRTAEMLATALGLVDEDREHFLGVARNGGRPATAPPGVPLSELPLSPAALVGRERELGLLGDIAVPGATVAIVGSPGVGKTALATFVARHRAPDFTDGHLAIDLRGVDEEPVTVRTALVRLLRAAGVSSSDIPPSEVDQVGLYRAVLARRRTLVLLDNAADEAQVRPLLAGAPGCLTLITCRRVLAGLEAVRWLLLEPLTSAAAIELLAAIAGPSRVRREPHEAGELVALCGLLPLAVRIVANQLVARPNLSLPALVRQLRDEGTRLTLLAEGDVQVRSAFDSSYSRLAADERLALRRLAALPGVDFGVELAQVATGMTEPEAHLQLDDFVDASLLLTTADERFQFHELIRIFAAERRTAEDEPAEHENQLRRMLGYLLDKATAAGLLLFPNGEPSELFASPDEAGEWLARAESNWVTALRTAARGGWHRQVVDLAKAMHWYSDDKWTRLPWHEIFQLGVDAAHALADRHAEAQLLNFSGWAQRRCVADLAGSVRTHQRALAVAVEAEDRREEAWAHAYLGTTLVFLGEPATALGHIEQARALSGQSSFWEMQGPIRLRQGMILRVLGRAADALSEHRALIADAEQRLDDVAPNIGRLGIAMAEMEIGHCLHALARWREAAAIFAGLRNVFGNLGSTDLLAEAALCEGRVWREAGDGVRARECFQGALTAYGEQTLSAARSEVLEELAELTLE
ncbi:helix-turn-helix domain-containing protein [Plantactinospora sp. WMMB782]|uniref:helix-turn-helix domain-containing protein n=1 Tax=Plantactinospora sp. WMMB782 TaxID=3404121 RepID=UPI003B93E1AB